MEFEVRESMRAARKDVVPESPESWQSHVEDDFGTADAASGDAAASSAERN